MARPPNFARPGVAYPLPHLLDGSGFEQQPASFLASGIQKFVDIRDKCLNEFEQYVEK